MADPQPDPEPQLLASAAGDNRDYTATASTCIRALALAVVAVTWLFLGDSQSDPNVTLDKVHSHFALAIALTAAIAAIALDAMQYAVGAALTQRHVGIYEDILADPAARDQNDRVAKAWTAAETHGFVERLLIKSNTHTSTSGSTRKDAISRARQVMGAYHDRVRGASTPTWYTGDVDARVRGVLADPRPALGLVSATRTLFWLKTIAALVGAGALVYFCAARLYG